MGESQTLDDVVLSSEAADILDVTVWTVHNMAKDGRLVPALKLAGDKGAYLFRRADVEALAVELRRRREARRNRREGAA